MKYLYTVSSFGIECQSVWSEDLECINVVSEMNDISPWSCGACLKCSGLKPESSIQCDFVNEKI